MRGLYDIVGGKAGSWRVLSAVAVRGAPLDQVDYVDVRPAGGVLPATRDGWCLKGQVSNIRYATRAEVMALRSSQEPLGRTQARRAALIPIRKTPAWWDLAQDERRAIFEEQSHHTQIGLKYLPAIARQLYHCRDLDQPFDFLTWFEFAPEFADAFEELVAKLRSTTEWQYVDREVDLRLERPG